jgi:ABC-type polysaccharide/polyol phosphate export permease
VPRIRAESGTILFGMTETGAAETEHPRQLGAAASVEQAEPAADHGLEDGVPFEVADLSPWVPTLRERIREAWESRHIARALAASIVPTYQGRVLGRAWFVIRPAMQIFVFALIFGGVFNASAPNGVPYLLFLVFSTMAFRFFERTVMYETLATRMVGRMTNNLRMPLLLIPVAATFTGVLVLLVYWSFAAVLLVYYLIAKGHFYLTMSPRLLAGVAGLALCLVFGWAIGLTTCTLYPRVRDVRYLVRYGMQFWIFLTPVFYSIESLPHWAQVLAQVNPLTPMVGLVQYGFLDAGGLSPYGLIWSVAAIILTGLFGLWFFNRFSTQWIGVFALPRGSDEEEDELL